MTDAGMGQTNLQKFLSGLGIPPAHHKTIKRKEREIWRVIESLARDTYSFAVNEEASYRLVMTKSMQNQKKIL